MKKIITVLLAVTLLLAAFLVPTSAAGSAKDYDSAKNGDLLYTVNFNGDDVFLPFERGPKNIMTYTPSADGTALTIKGKASEADHDSYWGAYAEGLTVNDKTIFSIKYQVNATASIASGTTNNSVGVGGLLLFEGAMSASNPRLFHHYSRHNSVDITKQRSIIYTEKGKMQPNYIMWNDLPKAVMEDAEAYITMMTVYDLSRAEMNTYFLATDNTWQHVEKQTLALTADDYYDANMGFMCYAYYNVIDTTIKNVEFYKGNLTDLSIMPEGYVPTTEAPTTEAPVTEAPVTDAPATEAPVTEAPATEAPATDAPATEAPATDAPATEAPTTEAPAKGGCGGVIGVGAIVAILGTAIVLRKKY